MKGQAAMEFLLTYGWAILIVIVMISGLAYLGILNPKDWVPNKCTFGAGMACGDYTVYDDGVGESVKVILTNNFGSSIQVKKVEVEDLDNTITCSCAGYCGLDGVWEASDKKTLDFSCTNKVNNVNLKVRITYKYIEGEYDRLVEGRIQSKVSS